MKTKLNHSLLDSSSSSDYSGPGRFREYRFRVTNEIGTWLLASGIFTGMVWVVMVLS